MEQKQRYIAQIMTGRSSVRSCEDIDDTVLQYAEFKALATSNPKLKEKMETDNEISRLTVLKSSWQSQRNDFQFRISKYYPSAIETAVRKIEKMTADLETYTKNKPSEFLMTIDGRTHIERTDAAEHLAVLSHRLGKQAGSSLDVGSYAGLTISLMRSFSGYPTLVLTGTIQYHTDMGESELGNISRIENLADRIEKDKGETENELANLRQQLADSLVESKKPFVHEDRLAELQKRKVELDLELEFKDDGDDVIDGEADEGDMDGEQTSSQEQEPDFER